MSHPVVCLLEEEKVERVRDILKIYPHDGFPVVDNYNPDLVSSSPKQWYLRIGMSCRCCLQETIKDIPFFVCLPPKYVIAIISWEFVTPTFGEDNCSPSLILILEHAS